MKRKTKTKQKRTPNSKKGKGDVGIQSGKEIIIEDNEITRSYTAPGNPK